jgi:DNA-binding MarR family transcriptional regulator
MSDTSTRAGLGTLLRRLLADLDGAVQAEYDRRAAAVRPKYYPVVRRLLALEDESIGALAVAAGVSQPAMTQTLREMQGAGLVAVAPGPDRREHRARLTAAGRTLAAELAPLWAAIDAAARQLEAEVGPLAQILAAAGDALRRESFSARIDRELSR